MVAKGKVRYHTKAYPNDGIYLTLDQDIYIPTSGILAIKKYETIAKHKDDPNNVFEGYDRFVDSETDRWHEYFFHPESPLRFDCTCKFKAGGSNDCTCGASAAILPLYQITVKNNGLHQMDHPTDPIYTPELVTYLVHPQERERMALLIAGHGPMTDLVNELRYNPSFGRLTREAREDFESATKRARVL